MIKKVLVSLFLLYTFGLLAVVLIATGKTPNIHALFLMVAGVFLVWVLIGGYLQRRYITSHYEKLTEPRERPILSFALIATLLACVEEMVTTLMTNIAPAFGVSIGSAYITASTNFFDVIFLHSVIVFVPMFFVLGGILKRYDISPFKAMLLFGIVGLIAEIVFSGIQTGTNAPFWILVYGLMVYLPAHIFINTERKPVFFLLYPIFIICILASAVLTAWIPASLHHPSIHFKPISLTS